MGSAVRLLGTLIVVASSALLAGCWGAPGEVHAQLVAAVKRSDALAISDALEELIATGKVTATDRDFALEKVRAHEENTVAYAFARAAITGRVVQHRGLTASLLIPDVERWARRSRELDPNFRDGAATRLLGTLYVLAPAALLKHGDSEAGLAMLEELTKKRPDVLENHLRLAEAYVALGDPGPAREHLCLVATQKAKLRQDDRALVDQLVAEYGALTCGQSAGTVTMPNLPPP